MKTPDQDDVTTTPPAGFPTTQWWLLLEAIGADDPRRREALEQLVRAYEQPIKAFVASRRGVRADQVDDIVQDFLTLKWVEQEFLHRASPQRGRFRAYLVVSLGRHVLNWLRDERAGARAVEHLGVAEIESGEADAQQAFDSSFARSVINEAIERFAGHCRQSGRPELWGVCEDRVLGPAFHGQTPVRYAELRERWGFESPIQAANLLVTAKRTFARLVTGVITDMEGRADDVEAEVRELLRALQKGQ